MTKKQMVRFLKEITKVSEKVEKISDEVTKIMDKDYRKNINEYHYSLKMNNALNEIDYQVKTFINEIELMLVDRTKSCSWSLFLDEEDAQ